jgi:hypothetical protein
MKENNKEYLLRFPESLHKALKLKSFHEDTTMQEIIIEAIKEKIKKEGK